MLLNEIHMAIVVFDDLMNEMCGDEMITNFFSRECHHRKLCIFHIWQNLFPQKKFSVTLSRNTQYKIVFKNPENPDNSLIHCSLICIHMITDAYIKKLWTFFIVNHRVSSLLLWLEHHCTRKIETVQL